MSHTLHRRGTEENLAGDYVVFAMSAKGINADNSRYALREFLEIVNKYHWVNMGDMKTGGYYLAGHKAIMEGVQDTSIVHGVFQNKEEFGKALRELKKADLGVSITISALLKDSHQVLREEGINPHTVELSLGIRGKTGRLPDDELLEITTMCGHGMVAQSFVRRMLLEIKKGKRSLEEAANYLATPCVCGVFNPRRAQMLLEELLDLWCMDEQ